MSAADDTLIPLSVLHSRLEKHRDALRAEAARLPWWAFRRQWIMSGAIASYQVEIDDLVQWGGSIVMRRFKERT